MNNYEIMDKIREVNGPLPELEPQIVKSRNLLTLYASVLLRRSESEYLEFCLNCGLPVDWMGYNAKEPLEPKDVAFTPEGLMMMLDVTKEDWRNNTYGAELLKHLIKLGPQSLTPRLKKKLFELTKSDRVGVSVEDERWSNDVYVHITVSPIFFSLLRGGYFLPGDEKIGRDIADTLGREIIDAYYTALPKLKKGGQIRANNVEKVFAVASEEVNDLFVRVLRATIGQRYHELNSKKRIDAINKLSGKEQMQAIRKHGEELANILNSLPPGKAKDVKKEIGWWR
jgi:hypothetical protein